QAGRPSLEHLREVVSDDFREIGMSGQIHDKSDALAALLKNPAPSVEPASTPQLVDFRAVEIAPGVALANYRTPLSLRTSIWRREAGSWRLYFHQGTRIPARDGSA